MIKASSKSLSEGFLPQLYISPQQKGKAFEDFIVKLFNLKSGRFELLSPDSENARVYGLAAVKCLYPDLKFLFYTKSSHFKFAIECKWKQTFGIGKMQWTNVDKMKRYIAYEKRNHITVFIAIGVGGAPHQPEKLFVTPLSHLNGKTEISETDLIPYKRSTKRNFFYDARQLKIVLGFTIELLTKLYPTAYFINAFYRFLYAAFLSLYYVLFDRFEYLQTFLFHLLQHIVSFHCYCDVLFFLLP